MHKKFIILIISLLIFSVNAYSIKLTVLPFISIEEWITNYNVDDGMSRVLEDSLINKKMFNVTDYDLLISYFTSYNYVTSYKILNTNIQLAADFIKETFNSDYIIKGEVIDFNLIKGDKYKANVKFKVDIIDINSLKILKSFINDGSYTLPNTSKILSSEDALFYETALGKASTIAFNKIVDDIVKYLNDDLSITGIITRIEGNKIYINIGKKNNIKAGDSFNIYDIHKILDLPQITENTNISNIPKINLEYDNNISYNDYMPVRSNEKGDIWYTSEMLYRYRHYKKIEEFITSAKVIELYENYSILENNSDKKIDIMMIVKINKE